MAFEAEGYHAAPLASTDPTPPDEEPMRELEQWVAGNVPLTLQATLWRLIGVEVSRLRAETAELTARLELEQRKDHGQVAWTKGYDAAVADAEAGRTAQWPPTIHAALSETAELRQDRDRLAELLTDVAHSGGRA